MSLFESLTSVQCFVCSKALGCQLDAIGTPGLLPRLHGKKIWLFYQYCNLWITLRELKLAPLKLTQRTGFMSTKCLFCHSEIFNNSFSVCIGLLAGGLVCCLS